MTRLLIAGAICIAFIPAHAQCKLCTTYVCDLFVDGYRVSWPPGILSERDCKKMKAEVEKHDETDADVECECTVGDRA